MSLDKQKVKEMVRRAEDTLFHTNIREFSNHKGRLIQISDCYIGVWMEHAYDALLIGKLYDGCKDISLSQARIFFENQREDGQMPAYVWNNGQVGYRHIQECVPFGRICYETYLLTKDEDFLNEAYTAFCGWDKWLCANRMTRKTGLIELFCEWDTGHDNSIRLEGIDHATPDMFGKEFSNQPFMPLIAPDMNAVFYGDRMALCDMARALGKNEEADAWKKKAQDVKNKTLELLYNKEDNFFYDVDKNGNARKIKTIQMANVFQAHVLGQDMFDSIYDMYFKEGKDFGTPVPFAATAVSDPRWVMNKPGNTWNFFSQALVALRTDFWMEHYGKTADYEKLLEVWLEKYNESSETVPFGQEFHPITGAPSDCSPYYSSGMLLYIRAARRLGLV